MGKIPSMVVVALTPYEVDFLIGRVKSTQDSFRTTGQGYAVAICQGIIDKLQRAVDTVTKKSEHSLDYPFGSTEREEPFVHTEPVFDHGA
jgi:hypothetical protein